MRLEPSRHHRGDRTLIGRGVKVQIASQVRVVIERLHHRRGTPGCLQLAANLVQPGECVGNARPLRLNLRRCPFHHRSQPDAPAAIAGVGHAAPRLPLQRLQRPQHHVVGGGQRDHFLALLLVQPRKSGESFLAVVRVKRKQRKDMDDFFFFGRGKTHLIGAPGT